jgi:hypothetical protein
MKNESISRKSYKMSFMIEGQIMREGNLPNGEIKETIITVKATKMDIQA